jgi:hypothetical protein
MNYGSGARGDRRPRTGLPIEYGELVRRLFLHKHAEHNLRTAKNYSRVKRRRNKRSAEELRAVAIICHI